MSASSTENGSGYDTSAVSWSTFISGEGVAIHAAFWHNYFGTPRSHGCINARPEDAKWIFRWSNPFLSLDQSEWRTTDWTQIGGSFSTSVTVNETKVPV